MFSSNLFVKRVLSDRLLYQFISKINLRQRLIFGSKKYVTKVNIKKSLRSPYFSRGIAGLGVGVLIGAGYSYLLTEPNPAQILNENGGTTRAIIKNLPNVSVSRKIQNPADSSGLEIVLFQYPTCPFCCKVRAVLDYYGISYDVVEVNPVLRQQIKWSDYKKVPILLAKVDGGYQQMVDSSMIVSAVASHLLDKATSLQDIVKCYPSISYNDDNGVKKSEIMNRYFLMYQRNNLDSRSNEEIIEERKWRKWADEVLVHTLSPNVYRTKEEALQSFTWFSEVGEWDKLFSSWEKLLIVYVGAFAMFFIGKNLKKRHNLKDDVRQSLYDECNYWVKALKRKGTPFIGGYEPNLADLAVYGVLSSIEGCKAFQDLLNNTQIGTWYWKMKTKCKEHSGSQLSQVNL